MASSSETHDPDRLEPPARTGLADPGAHDLGESSADESEDYFSDAVSDMNSPSSALYSDAKTKTGAGDTSIQTAEPIAVDTLDARTSSETINAPCPIETKEESEEETILETKPEVEIEADREIKTEAGPEENGSGNKETEAISNATKGNLDGQVNNKSDDQTQNIVPAKLADEVKEHALESQNSEDDKPKDDNAEDEELDETSGISLLDGMPIPTTILEESPGPIPPRSFHVEHTHATDSAPDMVIKPDPDEQQKIISEEATFQEIEERFKREELASKEDADDPITTHSNTLTLGKPHQRPVVFHSVLTDLSINAEAPKSPSLSTPSSPRARRRSSVRNSQSPMGSTLGPPSGDDFDDDFGDFDDFEEGGDDDGFGDFDDVAFQEPVAAPVVQQPVPPQAVSTAPPLPHPVPDFEGLDEDDIPEALDPYMNLLFPPENLNVIDLPPLNKANTSFLTQRSASLWSQLVAPPPLAPPDWIRSRIRRLFLVSLGVPVDLDEILPASKQKKLVLPSLQVPSTKSPRTSTDSRSNKSGGNNDGTSASQANGASKGSSISRNGSSRRRKGDKGPPELDLVSSKQLCMTTEEALAGMTLGELKAHLKKLKALKNTAEQSLEYWHKTTAEKVSERDALEGVIENLVKHARKVRK
ncbi:hypothetical protein Cpir12675_002912 [Ceratocystis pirilliformis]|uniref:Uncharacterized protein n=1 Tax=Ceratocystis pirilliformis TaxID=259994 RepID=A0ABR3Z804_9PEZI